LLPIPHISQNFIQKSNCFQIEIRNSDFQNVCRIINDMVNLFVFMFIHSLWAWALLDSCLVIIRHPFIPSFPRPNISICHAMPSTKSWPKQHFKCHAIVFFKLYNILKFCMRHFKFEILLMRSTFSRRISNLQYNNHIIWIFA